MTNEQPRASGGGDDAEPKKSAATRLVGLALSRYTLGVTPDGEPFAVPNDGPPVVRMLRGGRQSLRAELAHRYHDATGTAASQAALADACSVLEGKAQREVATELHLRVAEDGAGGLVLDLGDAQGTAVVISSQGWKPTSVPPVRFRRTALTGALPCPERGGSLDDLWALLNVAERYRPVLAAMLVAATMPTIPHPIVALTGEQGSGKSSAARTIAAVLDPSPAQLRTAPRDEETWITAAAGSWVVALDNLSSITPALSDQLARACTGDGAVKRRLYTDGDLHVVAFRRVVILNGITLGDLADDLADRLLTVGLTRIDDRARRLDAEVQRRWAAAHPRVLGALLDLTSRVLAELPSVHLAELPRMADFARVLAATDRVLGTDGLNTYLSQRRELAEDAVTSDPILVALSAAVRDDLIATAADLLDRLDATLIADDGARVRAPKGWPTKARDVTTLLTRRAPSLRRVGWTVSKLPEKDARTRAVQWQLIPPRDPREGGDAARVARIARNEPEIAGQTLLDGASDSASDTTEGASDTDVARNSLDVRSQIARTSEAALTCADASDASDASDTSGDSVSSPIADPRPLNTWRRSGRQVDDAEASA